MVVLVSKGQQHGNFVLQVLWFFIPHFIRVLQSLSVVMDLNEFKINISVLVCHSLLEFHEVLLEFHEVSAQCKSLTL